MVGGSKIIVCLTLLALVSLAGCAHKPPSPYGPGPGDPQAERIVIEKSLHRMTLYKDGLPWKEYRIALGKGGLAPKQSEGDKRTPEGLYFIKNRNPQSLYHLALRLDYPNEADQKRARALGVKPGHNIMIHGLSPDMKRYGGRHVTRDWTEGCIAVTDREIEDVWQSVADGTPVDIRL